MNDSADACNVDIRRNLSCAAAAMLRCCCAECGLTGLKFDIIATKAAPTPRRVLFCPGAAYLTSCWSSVSICPRSTLQENRSWRCGWIFAWVCVVHLLDQLGQARHGSTPHAASLCWRPLLTLCYSTDVPPRQNISRQRILANGASKKKTVEVRGAANVEGSTS